MKWQLTFLNIRCIPRKISRVKRNGILLRYSKVTALLHVMARILILRIILLIQKHIFYNMNLRVVRFPISDNDYECILTNLPDDEFLIVEIKELYALWWEIETSFRELKYAVGLTGFDSKKR